MINDTDSTVVNIEPPEKLPVRWAIPSAKVLRKQPTRDNIINETIHEEDEKEQESEADAALGTRLCFPCTSLVQDPDSLLGNRVRRTFLLHGVLVRLILMVHVFVVFWEPCSLIHVGLYAGCCLVYATISVAEAVIMYKMKAFSQKKWICSSTLLYTLAVVPAVWAMHIVLLNKRTSIDHDTCLDSYRDCIDNYIGNQTVLPTTTVTYSSFYTTSTSHQYIIVFVLILGRWLLPKDNFTREKLSQLLLVLVGSGEDIVEFATSTLSIAGLGCSQAITVIVLILWSISLVQFSIAIPEKRNRTREKPPNVVLNVWVDAVNQLLAQRRQTVGDVSLYVDNQQLQPKRRRSRVRSSARASARPRDAPLPTRYDWIHTTEVREAMISITIQDGPFFIFRVIIQAMLGRFEPSIFFYALKNVTVILLQIYRVYAMLVEMKRRRRSSSIVPIGNDDDDDDDDDDKSDIFDKSNPGSPVICKKAQTYEVQNEDSEGPNGVLVSNRDLGSTTKLAADDQLDQPSEVTRPTGWSGPVSETDLRTRRHSTIDEEL